MKQQDAVVAVAGYLRARPNREFSRVHVFRAVGVPSTRMESVLTQLAENYPQLGEDDARNLIWVDWDALS